MNKLFVIVCLFLALFSFGCLQPDLSEDDYEYVAPVYTTCYKVNDLHECVDFNVPVCDSGWYNNYGNSAFVKYLVVEGYISEEQIVNKYEFKDDVIYGVVEFVCFDGVDLNLSEVKQK